MMEYGLYQIKKIERLYHESDRETKDFIVSKIIELETEILCGNIIYQ